VDQHVAVLARNGERHLAFEIEVLLPADPQPALAALRACGEGRFAVVLAERVVGQHVGAGGERIVDRDAICSGRHLDLGEPGGAACLAARLRHNGEHDLTVKFDIAADEDRIVMQHRADIVLARDVRRGQHRDHARRRLHGCEIDAHQLAGRDRRAADRDVQQAFGLADIVDEGRAAGDMLCRRVVPHRAAHDTQPQCLVAAVKLHRHWPL